MDWTALISSITGMTIVGALAIALWNNLNAKVKCNETTILALSVELRKEYLTKENYFREMGTWELNQKELKDEMKENIKLIQQLIQDVGFIKARLDDVLKKG